MIQSRAEDCQLHDWVHLMEFPGEKSPVAWQTPTGETWYFALVEMPQVEEVGEVGTDFVWLRVDPDAGPSPSFRPPSITGFKMKPQEELDPADWWKSE